VQLRSERRFRFDMTRAELWTAIAAVDEYPRWWPWLQGFEGRALVAGDVWRATVQPPLPYSLAFTVALREVDEARRVVADIGGDICGSATLRLDDLPGGPPSPRQAGPPGCEACLVSELAPRHPVLRAAARLASPIVRYGHDWVLDTGARQFVDRAC